MTSEQIEQSEILFCDLLYEITGETLHFRISSRPQPTYSEEVVVSDEKFYNRIERLTESQENAYIMYINATNDRDADKSFAEYERLSTELSTLINS